MRTLNQPLPNSASAKRIVALGVSPLALVVALASLPSPASAQLMRLRAAPAGPAATGTPTAGTIQATSMRSALAQQASTQAREAALRSYATSIRQAVAASVPRANPANGLDPLGLYPVRQVRDLVGRPQAEITAGLQSLKAAADPTGKATWEGASVPVQTVDGSQTTVSITQTQERAVLSWNRMDVGAQTTLQFVQKDAAGNAQPGWIALNRVVDSTDPTTILGNIKADGAVYILNPRGVIFGKGAQVNLTSLVASTLEIGKFANAPRGLTSSQFEPFYTGASIQDRNTAFLLNGPFANNTLQLSGGIGLVPIFLSASIAPGAYDSNATALPAFADNTTLDAGVFVDAGASITSTQAGGYLMFAGPTVANGGIISAQDGQVSLQAGQVVTYALSSGDGGTDPDTRGVILRTVSNPLGPTTPTEAPRPLDGVIVNTGVVQSRRGYLSLGTGPYGSITNGGLLSATTSVSRNGFIRLNAGTISFTGNADAAQAGGLSILADETGETVPQGDANSPANFRTSRIEIAARGLLGTKDTAASLTSSLASLLPATVSLGENSLIYAPGANVTIGGSISGVSVSSDLNDIALKSEFRTVTPVTIGNGALIDVSGLKDVAIDGSRYIVTINPVKRNELRDTPNYRDVAIGDEFTLNGTTLTVDLRKTGVRSDGVRWVGSPLIEAGSLATQLPVSVSQFLTEGGNVSIAGRGSPFVLGTGAAIDVSGGWVSYSATNAHESQLITATGSVVPISRADPNDNYIGVQGGFVAQQPRFGIKQVFNTPTSVPSFSQDAYDEGRDAGSLIIAAPTSLFDGAVRGMAYAGTLQRSDARLPSVAATGGDPRKLQAQPGDLPSGAYVSITANGNDTGQGGDIIIYHGNRGSGAATVGETLLNDEMLSAAGLSALTLRTTGAITIAGSTPRTSQSADAYTFTGPASLSLAPGGRLTLESRRKITIDGSVFAPGGAISARTFNNANDTVVADFRDLQGSIFTTADDLSATSDGTPANADAFDIIVNGILSSAGLWTNDLINPYSGGGYTDGGSITLTVAANSFVANSTNSEAFDISGAISIAAGALLDSSAGGYVTPQGTLRLNGRGGAISLSANTSYAYQGGAVISPDDDGRPGGGLQSTTPTIDFAPFDFVDILGRRIRVAPRLTPSVRRAQVSIADGTLKGFGFTRGADFTLFAPGIAFNGAGTSDPLSTVIPLDFLERTGFGSLSLTANHSRLIRGLFANGRNGASAILDTTTFRIGAGQTLDLSTTLMPFVPTTAEQARLAALDSGNGALLRTVLAPAKASNPFDAAPVSFTLGGTSELIVDAGGAITGAPQASITAPHIVNLGTIRISGGSIAVTPGSSGNRFASVATLDDFFGPATAGQYNEVARNALFTGTNRDVLLGITVDRQPVLGGVTAAISSTLAGDAPRNDQTGLLLGAGSITDLSGAALFNPRAAVLATGGIMASGRVVAGGSISGAVVSTSGGPLDSRTFTALSGAIIDLDGAAGSYDVLDAQSRVSRQLQWSNGGTLAFLSGPTTLTAASLSAQGGAPAATGGTIEVLNAVLRQAPTGTDPLGVLFADQISAAGFDSFIANQSLTLDGNVRLDLGKAFILRSTDVRGVPNGTISATAATDATTGAIISAPYIRFDGTLGNPAPTTGFTGTGKVSFNAGLSGFDLTGNIVFGSSIGELAFTSRGDFRLTGTGGEGGVVSASNGASLVAGGKLVFNVGRVFATTGTGFLQRALEESYTGVKAVAGTAKIESSSADGITFLGDNINSDVPLSAGSSLFIKARKIVQNGHIAAPVGKLVLGDTSTESITFGAGSITSVYGGTQAIPYGTTFDLGAYYFEPALTTPLHALPSGSLSVTGGTITVDAGATVKLNGGADVFAFEFVSGVGGSRDVLSRFNTDLFSSNGYSAATGTGYQYADQRQVYAIVPTSSAAIAHYDPVYSADYGRNGPVDLYGSAAGLAITIDGSDLLPAGQYVLMPAHYALLPGALRVVENTGQAAPGAGGALTLLDGTVIVGGVYSTAGTTLSQSQRRSFSLQNAKTFLKYSDIRTTGGSAFVSEQAERQGYSPKRLPTDAASLTLAPLQTIDVKGLFDTERDVAKGQRGTTVDISGVALAIGPTGSVAPRGYSLITDATINALNAESIFIGGLRTELDDGNTLLDITAEKLTVLGGTTLAMPELLLATSALRKTDPREKLVIQDGATLTATGVLGNPTAGDYVVRSGSFSSFKVLGDFFRLSNGPDRILRRELIGLDGSVEIDTGRNGTLQIGAATISGGTLTLDTTKSAQVSANAKFAVQSFALSGPKLQLGVEATSKAFLDTLSSAQSVTLSSAEVISLDAGSYTFRRLVLDTPGIAPTGLGTGAKPANASVQITADQVRILNDTGKTTACTTGGALACGAVSDSLSFAATTVELGDGPVTIYGFGGGTTLGARNGITVEGKGSLNASGAGFTLLTPQIHERGLADDPSSSKNRIDYVLTSISGAGKAGALVVDGSGLALPADDTSRASPGGRIAFGTQDDPLASISIANARIRTTAGLLELNAAGDVALGSGASLSAPGFSRIFGDPNGLDSSDFIRVSANAGNLFVRSDAGAIRLDPAASLIVHSADGDAGLLSLQAKSGAITGFDAVAINAGINTEASGSLAYHAATSGLDLAGFIARYGNQFGGSVSVYAGAGDLSVNAGQTLRAQQVSLTADRGRIGIGGRIDTSGVSVAGMTDADAAKARVNGGDISLFGQFGVTLSSTAVLDAHSSGYADTDTRVASGGDVAIGIGNHPDSSIIIAPTARIDVGVRRAQQAWTGTTGARLVPQTVIDPATFAPRTVYRFVEADKGGSVTLRAPLIGAGFDAVNVSVNARSSIVGAGNIELDAYRQFDLGQIVASNEFSGVTVGTVTSPNAAGVTQSQSFYLLDLATNSTREAVLAGAKPNFLSYDAVSKSGTPTLVNFVRNFSVSADGSDLTGVRLRPGIDLIGADRGILLQTNWNLAAAEVDEAAAAAGSNPDLVINRELSAGLTKPVYSVVQGHEAHLLENFANFHYRVGGKFSGEAPVLSLRGEGDVVIERSISDGFFVFGDRTDPTYISKALGGGNDLVSVALSFSCGTAANGNCSNVADFATGVAQDLPNSKAVNISMGLATGGSILTSAIAAAPYSDAANSPAALGTLPTADTSRTIGNMAGAALSFGDVFPNLSDGSAPASSSINLVAGAATVDIAGLGSFTSSDPHIADPASQANVIVRDVAYSLGQTLPTSYALEVTVRDAAYSGTDPLELVFEQSRDRTPIELAAASFFEEIATDAAAQDAGIGALDSDSYTNFSFGNDAKIRAAAMAFFPADSAFKGAKKNPSGVYAPLSQVLGFLKFYENVYVPGVANGTFRAAKVGNSGATFGYGNRLATVQTVVRTGTGTINLSASNDIDLTGNPVPIYQDVLTAKLTSSLVGDSIRKPGGNDTLAGGASIYSVGHRVNDGVVTAQITRAIGSATSAASGGTVALNLTPALVGQAAPVLDYVPSPFGGTAAKPLALTGGGSLGLRAGRDILGRRDFALELTRFGPGSEQDTGELSSYYSGDRRPVATETAGPKSQRWRVGEVGEVTTLLPLPQYFSSGLGALGGGDISAIAGGSVDDVTMALTSSIVTGTTGTAPVLYTFGSGDLTLAALGDISGARIDVAHGRADIATQGSIHEKTLAEGIQGYAEIDPSRRVTTSVQTTRLRVTDANLFLTARDSMTVQIQSIDSNLAFPNGEGNMTAISGVDARANGAITILSPLNSVSDTQVNAVSALLPASLTLASMDGSLTVNDPQSTALLLPSPVGQLALFAQNDIANLSIAMLDNDPSAMNGPFSARRAIDNLSDGFFGLATRFPGVDSTVPEATRRLYHNPLITHANDSAPVQIFTHGSLNNVTINVPKSARVNAAQDIVDTYFVGQNLATGDVTRITAGQDITATAGVGSRIVDRATITASANRITSFIVGGPGTLAVEAGRNMGPFPPSGIVGVAGTDRSYTSGIFTVGNEYNPWLGSKGADISVAFGVAPGYDFNALQSTYLDPASYFDTTGAPAAKLDGDLFVQAEDSNGDLRPDRTKPLYAAVLALWLQETAPDAFAGIFGSSGFASDAALADAAYGRLPQLYAAFQSLPKSQQRQFLIQQVLFNEIKAAAIPDGPSFQQYIRGYRAIEALFPSALGYTDNLAVYDLDPATVSADHPLGIPRRRIVDGQLAVAQRVFTGSADFRLSAIETQRGGNITILAPGGDMIVGSQSRTSSLLSRLLSNYPASVFGRLAQSGNALNAIRSVPIASEGILTLRSGSIYSFLDGDLRLNQSRLFTNRGGDITAWSSNGDLAAGQGPRNASSFPPIKVRFDLNGFPTVDVAGSLSGAGIAAFKQNPNDADSDIALIAPVGLVDAGDAGVRSSGNIFVAAARVANADNFAAGGKISGVPTAAPAVVAAPSADPTKEIAAQVARSVNDAVDKDRPSQITVDILGYTGGTDCEDPKSSNPNCPQ